MRNVSLAEIRARMILAEIAIETCIPNENLTLAEVPAETNYCRYFAETYSSQDSCQTR